MTTGNKQQDPQPKTGPEIRFAKSSDFKSIYANYVQTGYTPYDISVTVGEAVGIDTSTYEVEQRARITFSPAEAKVLLAILFDAVKRFEAQYGDIQLPKGIAEEPELPGEYSKEEATEGV